MSFTVSKVQQFSQAPLQFVQPDFHSSTSIGLPVLGGIFSDSKHVWHAKGPCLEVRNTHSKAKVGAWTFGSILKDSNTRVICVEEIYRTCGRISLLAIGLECTITGGLICIFDVLSSTVIRTIHVKEKISHLKVVDPGLEVLNLPGPLHDFDGIICIGTEGGDVLLVDLCRQICEQPLRSLTIRDELSPCELTILTSKNVTKIDHFKEISIRNGNHLAIHLNKVTDSKTEHFCLKGPDGEDRLFVNKEEVVVSAIYYCPQLTSLLVGFNFGAFQLWNLTNLSLVYTSPVCNDHLPITNFALQEPTDDPRAFCYIWVSYSNTDLYQTGLPFAVMYSFAYETKEYHDGYGYLYQSFQHCSIRFQMELGSIEGYLCSSLPKGGKCLNLQPILKQPINKDLYAVNTTGDTLALCMISWSVWFDKGELQTNALIFDLNQWYKEQMPNFTKWKDCVNYILKVNVSELIVYSGRKSTPLLYLLLDENSLNQFISIQRLEEHFYPTSLSFDLHVLRENDVITIYNEGLQKSLLRQLEVAGPLSLIKPTDIYKQVIHLGLIPMFVDVLFGSPTSVEFQREMILNVALEYQLFGWICKCASEWANGSFSSSGCTLEFLLNWSFQRAVVLKTNCDRYCMPLFDYSQSRLDHNTSVHLNSCCRQINDLRNLYKYILKNVPSSMPLEFLTEQHNSLEMISTYFEVLQWLVNVGLLPEGHPRDYPRIDHFERISAPYPVQDLIEFYNEKRAHLRLISEETFASTDSLLFIDNLILCQCGAEMLQKQWQDDGGSGLYPPPSLQSMLRTYLVRGASISHKHSLIIYVFLDLAMTLDQTKYSAVITNLIKFPAVFKVSPSIIKITQAFWQLDHGDYNTAIEQLLDPFVLADDLQPWHHAVAMRALLLQEQYNLALLYMQIRKPPITDEKDILTAISLFTSNNMLDEALNFKRHCYNYDEEKLLKHFFNECNRNKTIHALLYKCLNDNEERAFFNYLKTINNPTASDLEVFYHLLRSRFLEAFDVHSHIKRRKLENQGLIEQISGTTTDQVVKIFKTLLPDVNKNLVDYIRKERANIWKEVPKPVPLSVFVHETNEKVHYKSTMIFAALAKAKETFNNTLHETKNYSFLTENTPFLRTPTAFKSKSRLSTPVIKPRFVVAEKNNEEMEATPSKRLKLSPRITKTSPTTRPIESIHSKILTPLVKRRKSPQKNLSQQLNNCSNICTPQSILKVRNLVHQEVTINGDSFVDNSLRDTSRRSSLGLQPRMSLSNPAKHHVKFDDKTKMLSSTESSPNVTAIEDIILQQASLSSQDASLMLSSNVSSTSTAEDTFYSPDNSDNTISKSETLDLDEKMDCLDRTENPELLLEKACDKNERHCDETENVQLELDTVQTETINMENISSSPKSRRSYKRSLASIEATRSSPRLKKTVCDASLDPSANSIYESKKNTEGDETESSLIKTVVDDFSRNSEPDESLRPDTNCKTSLRILDKVKSRKSLTRRVLENNTFLRCQSGENVSKDMTISKCKTTIHEEKTLDSVKSTSFKSSSNFSEIISTSSCSKHTSLGISKVPEIITNSDNKPIKNDNVLELVDNSIYPQFSDVPVSENKLNISQSIEDHRHNTELQECSLIVNDCVKNTTMENLNCESAGDYTNNQKETLSYPSDDPHDYSVDPDYQNESDNMNAAIIDYHEELSDDMNAAIIDYQKELSDDRNTAMIDSCVIQSPIIHSIEDDTPILPNVPEDQHNSNVNNRETQIILPMNVYEDLSSGSADIEETLERSRKHFNDSDKPDIQLRENILYFVDQVDEDKLSESCNLPESEVAFLEVQSDSSSSRSNASESIGDDVASHKNSIISISSEDSENCEKSITNHDSGGEGNFNVAYERMENMNYSEVSNSSESNQSSKSETNSIRNGHRQEFEKETSNNRVIVDIEESVQKFDHSHQKSDNDFDDENKTCDIKKFDSGVILSYDATKFEHVEIDWKVDSEKIILEETCPEANDNMSFGNNVQNEILKEESYQVASFSGFKKESPENVEPLNTENCSEQTVVATTSQSKVSLSEEIDPDNVNLLNRTAIISSDTLYNDSCVKTAISDKDSLLVNVKLSESMGTPVSDKENDDTITQTTECLPSTQKDEVITGNRNIEAIDVTKSSSKQELSVVEESIPGKSSSTKVDRETNTTLCLTSKETIIDQEDQVDDNLIQTASDDKLVSSKQSAMKIGEDSSSDTTDGDNFAQEIIVQAQVHTPRKKRTEEPLVKRVTRRNSALMSQNLEVEAQESSKLDISSHNSSLSLSDIFMKDSSPSPTVTPRTIRTRRSSHLGIVENNIDLDETKQSPCIIDMPNNIKNLMRRTRSSSVDINIKTYTRKRSTRSVSLDEKVEEDIVELPRRKGKASSVSHMPIISEENKVPERSESNNKRSASAIDFYNASRRLTRKQASILNSITNPSTAAQDDIDVEESIDSDVLDPMILLDKSPFRGKPDPDEEKVYNSSLSDCSAISQTKPSKRTTRSKSATMELSTPKRITRQRVSSVDSPLTPGTRTRSRKQSESSVASEVSGPTSPPKRAKKKLVDTGTESGVPLNTRSRASSVSSVTSDVSSSIASNTRGKKILVGKTSLPEIVEEHSENEVGSKKLPGRRIKSKYAND